MEENLLLSLFIKDPSSFKSSSIAHKDTCAASSYSGALLSCIIRPVFHTAQKIFIHPAVIDRAAIRALAEESALVAARNGQRFA